MSAYFLMKAQKVTPTDGPLRFGSANWLMSKKLDGLRAFWDGGVTRGRTDVPWNTGRMSTGLWSNNGKPLYPPSQWLDMLPTRPIDGELWAGPGGYQTVSSVCRKKVPTTEWFHIQFVEHTPISFENFLSARKVAVPHCSFEFTQATTTWFYKALEERVHAQKVHNSNLFHCVEKTLVTAKDWDWIINEEMPRILDLGHEGLVFHRQNVQWNPCRSWDLLKLKPFIDDEGTVVGVVSGRETDKGSKLLGLAGALVILWRGKKFLLSGFTNEERVLTSLLEGVSAEREAAKAPGELMPPYIMAKRFPTGSTITFKYRELTDDGIPKEARYWRKRMI